MASLTSSSSSSSSRGGDAIKRPESDKLQDDDDDDFYNIQDEIRVAPRPIAGQHSNIVDFYSGRSVLITGASGFIGKVLIEKLLRTCPTIERVYVLIRPKRNKSPDERLEELLKGPLFDSVRSTTKLEDRVIVVEGDVTQQNLGLSGQNLLRLSKEVSVIFHSAATVKFDEPLKQSIAINIAGTKNMIEFCRRCGSKLAALVHVSTAYANCDRNQIDEHVYPANMDPDKLIQMADWLDVDTLQELKRRLLEQKPNTYTYTKALAEWLLIKSARDLPVVICRPSIVVASKDEPFKGWIDNINGPTGIITGVAKGFIRSIYVESSCVADIVPVDKVINLIVTLGWFAHIHNKHLQKDLSRSASSSSLSPRSSPSLSGDDGGNDDDNSDNNHTDHLHQPHSNPIDDGYGSRSSDYADSKTSTATNSSIKRNRNRTRSNQNFNQQQQEKLIIRISSTSEAAKQFVTDANSSDTGAEQQQQQQHQHNCLDSNNQALTGLNIELEYKLKQFRQRTRDKLIDKELPEGLADVPVFHSTSGGENPITWGRIRVLVLAALSIFPCITTYRYPCDPFTNNKTLDDFYRLTLHYIPGAIVDFITKLMGGKPIICRIYERFDQTAGVLKSFTTKQWQFDFDNRLFLMNELMNDEDRRLFNCDMSSLDWQEFITDYVVGVRKFLLKEPIDNLAKARSNLNKVYYRNLSLQVLSLATITYYCLATFYSPN